MVLAVSTYGVIGFFLVISLRKVLALGKSRKVHGAPLRVAEALPAFMGSLLDIVLMRRLFIVNPGVWFGEWLFHLSLLLIVVRHLRFLFASVPGWVWRLQAMGEIASYLLPVSVVYIFVIKVVIEKKRYLSSYNFFILALVLAQTLTGLSMRHFAPADLVSAKDFVLSILSFKRAVPPESLLFALHFALFLVLCASLPSHVFAAPLTLLDARMREKALPRVLHED
ncbi:MAG TPA: hypothetical protein VLD40_04490 [Dissulfurispiraceae bacterium]|nr:hypothetical protein [Dissulfurispiraceae bacterium]